MKGSLLLLCEEWAGGQELHQENQPAVHCRSAGERCYCLRQNEGVSIEEELDVKVELAELVDGASALIIFVLF